MEEKKFLYDGNFTDFNEEQRGQIFLEGEYRFYPQTHVESFLFDAVKALKKEVLTQRAKNAKYEEALQELAQRVDAEPFKFSGEETATKSEVSADDLERKEGSPETTEQ